MVDEAPEGSAALSMCLEALLVLANPDVALQPSLSRDKRLAEDVPPLADLTTVVTALLAALQHLSKVRVKAQPHKLSLCDKHM